MRNFFILLVLAALSLPACGPKKDPAKPLVPPALNALTADEIASGWELLFNGYDLQGWKRYNADSIGPLWKVEDFSIVCDGRGLTEGTADIGGSLMTTREFGNFELSLEWKIGAGGNSGILYHVVEAKKYKHDYETGPEYQVMDDSGWEGEPLKEAQRAGSSYDMFPAPVTKKLMPAGEWNTAKVSYYNGHVEQWLNGEKVVSFDENSKEYDAQYEKSKWKGYPDWNKSKTGHITLQDHGARVAYRNIRVRIPAVQ